MNKQEVTMQHTRNGNRFQVLDKATQASGLAFSLALRAQGILTPTGAYRGHTPVQVNLWRSSGRAVLDIVPETPSRTKHAPNNV